jgi:excisionase family DNA binding protein
LSTTIDLEKGAYTSAESAKILNVSVPTLKGWVENGLLKTWSTKGGHMRIDRGELRRFAAERGYTDPFEGAGGAAGDAEVAPVAAPPTLDESLWALSQDELAQLLQPAVTDDGDGARAALLRALANGPLSAPELAEALSTAREDLDARLQAMLDDGDLLVAHEAPIRRYCLRAHAYLLKLLHQQELSLHELAQLTGFSPAQVQSALSALAQAKLIVAQPGALLQRFLSTQTAQARVAARAAASPAPRAAAPRAVERPRAASDIGAAGDEHLLAWCQEQCATAPGHAFKVTLADLVNRRGRFQAKARLRAKAVQDVAHFIFDSGFHMSPDYRDRDGSPGIETTVWVRFISNTDEDADTDADDRDDATEAATSDHDGDDTAATPAPTLDDVRF